MYMVINAASELPIYRQLMRQVMDGIAGGHLRPGEQLPSHRELSEQLAIAPLTVKKAYDELEAQGYLETVRGRGTYVSARPPAQSPKVRTAALHDLAKTLVAQAYLAGLGLSDVLALVEDADHALLTPPAKAGRFRNP
jgi:GntR family transcriptional regulator